MQTFSRNAALLIIDVQKGFDEPSWGRRNNPQMEARIVELLDAWRASNRPVIHAKHMSLDPTSPLRPGQPGNDFKAQVTPMSGESVVEKRVNSCFIGTPLEAELRGRGHDSLVVVGMMTNHCVSTTTRMAGNLGFAVWVVSDATATFDRVGPDGIKYPAEQIHAIALADLHGEFGAVVDTATVLAAMRKPADSARSQGISLVASALLGAAITFAPGPAPCATPAGSPSGIAVATHDGGGYTGVELADLNRSVDACTDFYEFANGTWRAENPIPTAMPQWSRRLAAHEANRQQVQSVLDEVSRKKDWAPGSAEQLVGDHYASCMDEAGIDAEGLKPLAPVLAEIDGVKTIADAERIIRRLHDLAISVPFGTIGAPDYNAPTDYIANIVAGGLGLPDRDYYLKAEPRFAEAREKYRVHMANVLKLSGMPDAQARESADRIFSLEKSLAEASLDSATAGDPAATNHKTSFAELKKLAPHFDWDKYFDEAKLPRADLNVAEPKFVQQLDQELKQTPVATWRVYLKWQLLNSASPWLSKPFVDESFDFADKYLGKASEPKPRAQRCVDSTDALLGDALGRKYVERYFPPAAKAKSKEIASNLLAALKDQVAGEQWMTPAAKAKALAKLAATDLQLGYPDEWKDYSTIVVRRDAFWANVAAARKFAVDEDRLRIGKPTNRDLWALTPSSPDAYLDLQLNKLVLPAGFLQPPYFKPDASDAVNYGAFGIGLAHDLTHAIDASGSAFDSTGRPETWWTPADRNAFEQRGQCIVEQFDGYFIEPGVHHDGKRVLSESIADLAGVHIAYLALEKSMKSHPVRAVDGFTPEQQFFISWGQTSGASMRLDAQRRRVSADPHPVPKFRVIGPFSNSPEFQQAFSCNAGAEMVRPAEKRCAVW